jgi:GMP synthase (glutamine-hydrolysing)
MVRRARREVVVIQHVDVEGPGRLARALDARGLPWRTVRSDLGQPLPGDLTRLAGLVILGGPMGVRDAARLPFLSAELRLLERTVSSGVPVLGVCLGSQLLAAALGAGVRRGAAREIGWLPVEVAAGAATDAILEGAPRTFSPLHWHGDVFDLPRGATLLARSAATACQAFRHGRSAWGLLFHLEVQAGQVARMAVRVAGPWTGRTFGQEDTGGNATLGVRGDT